MTESTINTPEMVQKCENTCVDGCENGPDCPGTGQESVENTVKTPENGPKYHLNYAARVVISPTFNTETGERADDTEFLEYKCTSTEDCSWNIQAHSAGEAGYQVILHTLGIDGLNIDFRDAKVIAESLNFDPDNPKEVLKAFAMQQANAQNESDPEKVAVPE